MFMCVGSCSTSCLFPMPEFQSLWHGLGVVALVSHTSLVLCSCWQLAELELYLWSRVSHSQCVPGLGHAPKGEDTQPIRGLTQCFPPTSSASGPLVLLALALPSCRDEESGRVVLSHCADSTCAAGTAGWGCPCPAALGAWLHLRAPGTGKMGSFCSLPQAGMSEPGCRDMGDAQRFPCLIVSCVGCPVFDSLCLAVLVMFHLPLPADRPGNPLSLEATHW